MRNIYECQSLPSCSFDVMSLFPERSPCFLLFVNLARNCFVHFLSVSLSSFCFYISTERKSNKILAQCIWIPLKLTESFNNMVIGYHRVYVPTKERLKRYIRPHFLHCWHLMRDIVKCFHSWWQIEFKLKSLFIGKVSERLPSAWNFYGIKKGCLFSLTLLFFSFLSSWVIYEFLKYFFLWFIYSFQITWSNLRAINIGIGYNLILKGARYIW